MKRTRIPNPRKVCRPAGCGQQFRLSIFECHTHIIIWGRRHRPLCIRRGVPPDCTSSMQSYTDKTKISGMFGTTRLSSSPVQDVIQLVYKPSRRFEPPTQLVTCIGLRVLYQLCLASPKTSLQDGYG